MRLSNAGVSALQSGTVDEVEVHRQAHNLAAALRQILSVEAGLEAQRRASREPLELVLRKWR